MNINDLILESKMINIKQLDTITKKSKKPIYILVAGSVGSGKSFVVDRDLKDIHKIDPDIFTMALGKGVYDSKNVAKSMAMVKKAVTERLASKKTFLQQGTSANLSSTINKLKVAKQNGFKTVLLYIDIPIEQAFNQISKRVTNGGHGNSITIDKVKRTSDGAKLTFRTLSGVDFDKLSGMDLDRVSDSIKKEPEELLDIRNYLDYYLKIDNRIH